MSEENRNRRPPRKQFGRETAKGSVGNARKGVLQMYLKEKQRRKTLFRGEMFMHNLETKITRHCWVVLEGNDHCGITLAGIPQ